MQDFGNNLRFSGTDPSNAAEQRALRLLAEELKRRAWDEAELKRRKKNAPIKAEIAQRLRRETTATWDWIARGLIMGASGYTAHCVRSILTGG